MIEKGLICDHCGASCEAESFTKGQNTFCCTGCMAVYELLEAHRQSGNTRNILGHTNPNFAYLEDDEVKEQLLDFQQGKTASISFTIPAIHCSSCMYLLEHLPDLHEGIQRVRVHFLQQRASVRFDQDRISLRQVVELLHAIGYTPQLSLQELESKGPGNVTTYSLLYRLGVAGFCFGNIMLFSMPDYLGMHEDALSVYFHIANVILILPVITYAASDYWRAAWRTVRTGRINIDIPIVLGILTLAIRSFYELAMGMGEGYFDSLAGFVFFLLIGKWFQARSFRAISFDRDYKSFFPISVLRKVDGEWNSQSIHQIQKGDHLFIREGELIPMDAQLISTSTEIDYSFVTGESRAVSCRKGDMLYAGGRQLKAAIEVRVVKAVDQSYLSQLWDEQPFQLRQNSRMDTVLENLGRWFTTVVLLIAILAGAIWWAIDPSRVFEIVTAVLIVACPCAIALAVPFTYGGIVSLLGRQGFFMRNVEVIHRFHDIDYVVLDKTGTLTNSDQLHVQFEGDSPLTEEEKNAIASICMQSIHPKSQAIVRALGKPSYLLPIIAYKEHAGLGLQAVVGGIRYRIGSAAFIFETQAENGGILIEIEGEYRGRFRTQEKLYPGMGVLIQTLTKKYSCALLSGDHEGSRDWLQELFPVGTPLLFQQKPIDKLNYIENIQKEGKKVLFIGDGLNDAGALKQADLGIALSKSSHHFTPASDVIIDVKKWPKFQRYLTVLSKARTALYIAFVFALCYNIIGLGFALFGYLSPIVAAILMPLSSLSIIAFGLLAGHLLIRKYL